MKSFMFDGYKLIGSKDRKCQKIKFVFPEKTTTELTKEKLDN